MPEISIIVPVYNAERYIERCIRSLLDQTYTNIEVICVNDGSHDESGTILQNFAKNDPRVKYFEQDNAGPGAARQCALNNATGTYIMFCDSDDWYAPSMCEMMHDAMIKNNVDLAMCDTHMHEESKKHNRPLGIQSYYRLKMTGFIRLVRHTRSAVNVLLWNKIFKKSLIDQYGVSFPFGCASEDASFIWQYLSVSQSFYGVKKILYNHMLRESSIMGKFFSKSNNDNTEKYDLLRAASHTIDFLNKNHVLDSQSFFMDVLLEQIGFSISMLSTRKSKENALDLVQKIIIPKLSKEIISEFYVLEAIHNNNYDIALSLLKMNRKYLNHIKFAGFTVYKKKVKDGKFKHYVLGIPIFIQRCDRIGVI